MQQKRYGIDGQGEESALRSRYQGIKQASPFFMSEIQS